MASLFIVLLRETISFSFYLSWALEILEGSNEMIGLFIWEIVIFNPFLFLFKQLVNKLRLLVVTVQMIAWEWFREK